MGHHTGLVDHFVDIDGVEIVDPVVGRIDVEKTAVLLGSRSLIVAHKAAAGEGN
jgi:hypothetical protein